MAEEKEAKKEKKKEGAEAEDSPKKRSKIKLIGICAVSLGLVGGGGYFGYKKFVAKKPVAVASEAPSQAKASAASRIGPLFKMDTFIVNLTGDSGARYLKTTMQLELSDALVTEELMGRNPQVRDLILTLLSSKSFGEISSTAGKFALREEMVSRLNELLATGEVRQVYFTEFVVQ